MILENPKPTKFLWLFLSILLFVSITATSYFLSQAFYLKQEVKKLRAENEFLYYYPPTVEQLQLRLIHHGYQIWPDDIFGPETKAAMDKYHQDNFEINQSF